jgi:hypothetical protein
MIDANDIFDMAGGPGVDPRQWVSYGTVSRTTEGQEPLNFDEQYGQPLVAVTLQPSGLEVLCRVSSSLAGLGEGEWYPFVSGDEVLVVIPQGDEKNCCIIGRLNNEIDAFPKEVAGIQVKENRIGFRKHIAPFVVEFDQSYMIRNSKVKSYISFDSTGNVTVSNSDNALLILNADVIGLQSADGESVIQIPTDSGNVLLQAGKSQLQIGKNGNATTLYTDGEIQFSAKGAAPVQHVLTTEQLYNIVQGALFAFAYRISTLTAPLTGSSLAALLLPNLIDQDVATGFMTASTTGLSPLATLAIPALSTALTVPINAQNRLYGVGCPSLLGG